MSHYKCPHCGAVEQYRHASKTPGGITMQCEVCDKYFTDGQADGIDADITHVDYVFGADKVIRCEDPHHGVVWFYRPEPGEYKSYQKPRQGGAGHVSAVDRKTVIRAVDKHPDVETVDADDAPAVL